MGSLENDWLLYCHYEVKLICTLMNGIMIYKIGNINTFFKSVLDYMVEILSCI